MNRQRFLMLTSGLAIGLAMASVAAARDREEASPRDINPANFVDEVTNRYFPLKLGTKFFYEGYKGEEPDRVKTRDVVHVTHDTENILDVECIKVHHLSYEDDVLVEETFDYYAQDNKGNVWYFGEDSTANPGTSEASTEGSWRAGEDDAQPGIIMEAHPRVDDSYLQENAPGVAQDMAQVLSLDESIRVLGRRFEDVLLTKEWSQLDNPVVFEQKYYVNGIGFVRSEGDGESSELVHIDSDD